MMFIDRDLPTQHKTILHHNQSVLWFGSTLFGDEIVDEKDQFAFLISLEPIDLLCVQFLKPVDDLLYDVDLEMYDGPGKLSPKLRKVHNSWINIDMRYYNTRVLVFNHLNITSKFDSQRLACFTSYQGYLTMSQNISFHYQGISMYLENANSQGRKLDIPRVILPNLNINLRKLKQLTAEDALLKVDTRDKTNSQIKAQIVTLLQQDQCLHCVSIQDKNTVCFSELTFLNYYKISIDEFQFFGPDTYTEQDLGHLCHYGGLHVYLVKSSENIIYTSKKKLFSLCTSMENSFQYTFPVLTQSYEKKSLRVKILVVAQAYHGYSQMHLKAKITFLSSSVTDDEKLINNCFDIPLHCDGTFYIPRPYAINTVDLFHLYDKVLNPNLRCHKLHFFPPSNIGAAVNSCNITVVIPDKSPINASISQWIPSSIHTNLSIAANDSAKSAVKINKTLKTLLYNFEDNLHIQKNVSTDLNFLMEDLHKVTLLMDSPRIISMTILQNLFSCRLSSRHTNLVTTQLFYTMTDFQPDMRCWFGFESDFDETRHYAVNISPRNSSGHIIPAIITVTPHRKYQQSFQPSLL